MNELKPERSSNVANAEQDNSMNYKKKDHILRMFVWKLDHNCGNIIGFCKKSDVVPICGFAYSYANAPGLTANDQHPSVVPTYL